MKVAVFLSVSLVGLLVAVMTVAASPKVSVKTEIALQGTVTSKATIISALGRKAEATQNDETGRPAVHFEIVSDEMKTGQVAVELKVSRIQNGEMTVISQPRMITRIGEPAEMTVSDDSGDTVRVKVLASEN